MFAGVFGAAAVAARRGMGRELSADGDLAAAKQESAGTAAS
jgi:hypothetical protein